MFSNKNRVKTRQCDVFVGPYITRRKKLVIFGVLSCVSLRHSSIGEIGCIVQRKHPIRGDFHFASNKRSQCVGGLLIGPIDHGCINPSRKLIDLFTWIGCTRSCRRIKRRTKRLHCRCPGSLRIKVSVTFRDRYEHRFR